MPNCFVQTRTLLGGTPVSDVFVALHLTTGEFVASGTTLVDGLAFLGNRPVGQYEIRITPQQGHRVAYPLQSVALAGTGDNIFDVPVETTGMPAATDSRYCRCSGFFSDGFATARKSLRIHFSDGGTPQLLIDPATRVARAVSVGTFSVITDTDGFAMVDLLRNAEYCAVMAGYEDSPLIVRVPDQPSASLPDVLFPMVDLVEFWDGGTLLTPVDTPAITVSLADGSKRLDTVTVLRSGVRQAGLVDVKPEVADATVFTCATPTGGVLLLPHQVGTSTMWANLREAEQGKGTTASPPATRARGTLQVTVVP